MLSARAAAEKEPVSTTRTKACIAANRSMLIPPRNGVYLPNAPAASIAQRSTSMRSTSFHPREVTETAMTLQAKLDAFKADFEAGKPPYSVPRSVIDTMHRATEELIASGAATRALKAGDTAPPFVLKD